MKYLIEFLESKDIKKSKVYRVLKCSKQEIKVLKYLTKEFIEGNEDKLAITLINELYTEEKNRYAKLDRLNIIKKLLDNGWLVYSSFSFGEIRSQLELLYSSISLSPAFLKLLEVGVIESSLPKNEPYNDHLEYLKDQFYRIDLYQKTNSSKNSIELEVPNINRLKNRLQFLEKAIDERIALSSKPNIVEELFKEYGFGKKEQIIFLALLKEEYSGGEIDTLRDMNSLIELVSFDEYEKIKNRSLLEEDSKLVESGLIDYDEIMTMYGGITRSFFITENTLHKIMHPNKNDKKEKKKIKLDLLIKDQDIFELVEPKTAIDDVVLNPKTKEIIDHILKQMDKNVLKLLRKWGVKNKKRGIDAKLLFYGAPGTGKTMTAYSLAKSLKKRVLSFDCSKILSMYVGESEKNVRNIFDTYKELVAKSKSEPVLLLNEADQFLGQRTSANSSIDKMHNQMQNIFLEQIEEFDGILIATTNLLDSLDKAFSRRFDFKLEFQKPNLEERVKLWRMMLPIEADYEENFELEKLAKYNLTGGQIKVVIKNCAIKVAIKDEPIFMESDFVSSIQRELKGSFGDEKVMGFNS